MRAAPRPLSECLLRPRSRTFKGRSAFEAVARSRGSQAAKAALFEKLIPQIQRAGNFSASRLSGTEGSIIYLGRQGEPPPPNSRSAPSPSQAGRFSPAEAVERYEQRNIREYGNPLGPTIEQLRNAGESWEDIIESASRPGGRDLGF